MSSNTQNPPGGYAPPPGAPPLAGTSGNSAASGAPQSQSPYPPPAGAPPPGQQQQYSVYPPPGAYAAGPPPPGGYYPPPGGYYPPPPGQYPQYPGYYTPPGQYPAYPPPGQYPPPAGQYPPPAGQYPPPAGQYPPPTGAYPPPAGAPGAPGAPGGPGAPATPGTAGQPGAPPAGQYAPPAGPPPAPYGAPASSYPMPGVGVPYPPPGGAPYYPVSAPPQPHLPQDPLVYLGAAIPNPDAPHAALGVQRVPGWDPSHDYNSLVRAISSDGVGDEKKLLNILIPLNVFQMDALSDYYLAKTGISLAEKLQRSTGGNFGTAIQALALGPLGFDVYLAKKAIVGLGTDETLLIELMLGRQAFEIRWLKTAYRLRYGKDLVDAVKSDLSGATMEMFGMVLAAQKPVNPYVPPTKDDLDVKNDAKRLHEAVKRKSKGWEVTFFEVFINRSDLHLAAVIDNYNREYKSLSKVIKKEASGTIREGLLYILHGVKSKRDGRGYWRDGKLLEKSMAGLGTKDTQLIYRLTRAHWDPQRMEAVKDAYQKRYKKPLENRVKGETSGVYRDLLVALVRGPQTGPKY